MAIAFSSKDRSPRRLSSPSYSAGGPPKPWSPTSPGLRSLGWKPILLVRDSRRVVVAASLLCLLGITLHAAPPSVRKQQAREQFDKAEQMREALNGQPADERTRKDFQHVADAYRKVYYVAPASSKADASVIAVAEILAEMGRQFQPGEKDLRASIGEYEFLRREYPGSKYRFQALFTIGQIYKEDLGDDDAARQTFEDFLKHYPRNSLAPQAKQALAELNQPPPAAAPATPPIEAGPCSREVGGSSFSKRDAHPAHTRLNYNHPKEETGPHSGDRNPPLVDARLHSRGHRSRQRGQVRSRSRAQSRSHLL